MVFRYGIRPLDIEFNLDWEKYRIVEDNATHHMGNVAVALPQLGYRMPFENGNDIMALSRLDEEPFTHWLFFNRIDEEVDTLLEMACRKTMTDTEKCDQCLADRFLVTRLQPAPGDLCYLRTSFPYKNGIVHYMKSGSTVATTDHYHLEYQAMYFPTRIGNGPALVLNHCISGPQSFCHHVVENPERPGFSMILSQILDTVKTESEVMHIIWD